MRLCQLQRSDPVKSKRNIARYISKKCKVRRGQKKHIDRYAQRAHGQSSKHDKAHKGKHHLEWRHKVQTSQHANATTTAQTNKRQAAARRMRSGEEEAQRATSRAKDKQDTMQSAFCKVQNAEAPKPRGRTCNWQQKRQNATQECAVDRRRLK